MPVASLDMGDDCGVGTPWLAWPNHLLMRLTSGSSGRDWLQLHKASVETVKILDYRLPCCQTVGESNLTTSSAESPWGDLRMYVSSTAS